MAGDNVVRAFADASKGGYRRLISKQVEAGYQVEITLVVFEISANKRGKDYDFIMLR